MSHALNIHDGLGIIARDPALGILLAYGSNVPGAVRGYAPGCKFLKTNGTSVGTVEYVNIGTFASASFVAAGIGGGVNVSYVYGDQTLIDTPFFICDKPYTVTSIILRPLVAGTDAGAVTAVIRRAGSGTAIGSGTALHTGSLNLKATINTNITATLSGTLATLQLAAGNAIGINPTGVTTAARGVVMVSLLPT